MRPIHLYALAAALLALPGAALASPFRPMFDFRDGSFAPPGPVGGASFHAGGHDITLEALAFDGLGGFLADGRLYWDDSDGFGIRGAGYEDDEIEHPEVLAVRFDSPLFVERVLVADLFLERFTEEGRYSVDGGATWVSFFADGRHPNGEVGLPVGERTAELLFTALGLVGDEDHEFAVAGLDIAGADYQGTTPEPGAALLFSAGLLLVGGRRRRPA